MGVGQPAKIAVDHCRSRNRNGALTKGLPVFIQAYEPKGLVLSVVQLGKKHRATRSKAPVNLVICIRRTDDASIVAIDVIKCASSIEEGIAVDGKYISVNGIRSGFQLVLGNALGEAVLRGEGALQNGEFLERFEGRIDIKLEALGFREGDWDTIEDNFVLEIQPAIDAVAEAITRYSRGQEKKGIDLAA